jgi:hypothetical protein
MKKLFICLAVALFSLSVYSQQIDTSKTLKYQCLTVSKIMNNKIADVWLDDGIKNRSVGVKSEDGTLFKSNIEVLNYVCKKYNLELVAVTEDKAVYRFYLVKK